MPKKKKREPPEDEPEESTGDRWLYNGVVFFLLLPFSIYLTWQTGSFLPAGFGGALTVWRIAVTPEIRNRITFNFNLKGKKQSLKMENSPGSQAIAVAGDQNQILLGQPNQPLRELAQQVYTPLIREGTSGLENNRYVTQIFMEWDRLKREEPYWTAQVPGDIVEMFESAKPSYDRLSTLTPEFQKIVSNASFKAIERVGLQPARPGTGMVSFRILQGDMVVRWVYVRSFWESGKRLKELVHEHVKYPDIGFSVDLQIDGLTIGDMGKAFELADTIYEFLEKEPVAIEVQDRTMELTKRAEDIVSRIREELKKG